MMCYIIYFHETLEVKHIVRDKYANSIQLIAQYIIIFTILYNLYLRYRIMCTCTIGKLVKIVGTM